jgi:hypothetical protein
MNVYRQCTSGLPSTPSCSWAGVVCDSGGCKILSLNLGQIGLQGTLSSAIGSLSSLQGLNVSNNLISGTLPPSIGLLTGLVTLILNGNKFTGPFPFICVGANYNCTTIPPQGLTKVTLLQANANSFSCLPDCLLKIKPPNWGLCSTQRVNAIVDSGLAECVRGTPTAAPSTRSPQYPTAKPTSKPTFTAVPSWSMTPTANPSLSKDLKWQAGIFYHGGPISTGTTSLYNVFYGDFSGRLTHSNPRAVNVFNNFTAYIGSSAWFNITTTYWDSKNQIPRNAAWNGTYFINSTIGSYPTSISDNDIQSILTRNIIAGKLYATPGFANNVYVFIVSEDVIMSSCDCTVSCGYHNFVVLKVNGVNTRINYVVAANTASSAQCGNGCTTMYRGAQSSTTPNGNFIADGERVAILISFLTAYKEYML